MKLYWENAWVLALRTAAQAELALLGTTAVITHVDWQGNLTTVVLATVSSLLMSAVKMPNIKQPGD